MWTEPGLNWRHTAFQAVALPTELPVQHLYNTNIRNKLFFQKGKIKIPEVFILQGLNSRNLLNKQWSHDKGNG